MVLVKFTIQRDGRLTRIRAALAQRTGRPVTFGWGPRFLHSTGQFHKGGPAVGSFLQVTGMVEQSLKRDGWTGTVVTSETTGMIQPVERRVASSRSRMSTTPT